MYFGFYLLMDSSLAYRVEIKAITLFHEHNHSHQQIQCGSMTQHIGSRKTMSTEDSALKVLKVVMDK
jgi:hypothetical protein